MESDSTNLESIIEEEEENEASTVGSDKKLSKQDLSIQEMEDKENIHPEHMSDSLVSGKNAPQWKKTTKKKGFNLRKSLAWNPAFFTEEGVLDPAELSYISGSLGESNRSVKSGNSHMLNEAVQNSHRKSQMKSKLRGHSGRKLFTTPEPSRRQEKKAPEGTRNLNPGGPSTKTLLRPPTTNSQKRVANTGATGHVPKVQKFMLGSTISTSQISNNHQNVPRSVKGKNSNCPKGIRLNQEKEPLVPPKFSTGAENNAAPQMISQTIPKPPTSIKPSGLRKPSPSFGFFAQGKIAAQSGNSSQQSTEKTLTGIPSSLPKHRTSKWQPPSDHLLITGTSSQSKIPRIKVEQSMGNNNTTGMKCREKSTRTPVGPREKLAASHLACNRISPETCSTKDLGMSTSKSKDVRLTEKSTIVSVDAKEPAIRQFKLNLAFTKTCAPMDVHVSLTKPNDAVLADDRPKKLQAKNSSRVFVEAKEEPPAAQHTKSSILIETCSSIDENVVVSKSDDVRSDVHANGTKHMERENRVCEREEETVILLIQNSVPPETCSPMDVDMVMSKSNDVDLRVDTDGTKCTGDSSTVCEGQKEEAVVTPSTCSSIPPETCSSKDKHTTIYHSSVNGLARGAITNVSPLRTQRGKTDFSPCKDKSLEKRLKSDSGSSLIIKKESTENEKPEVGKVDKIAEESSQGRIVPKFRKDLVPFSDEWLAALEASGEEILEKKTGPVQNSPPDKTVPEPSPWSPIKKKVQEIGPYDCTKYSKTISSSEAQ